MSDPVAPSVVGVVGQRTEAVSAAIERADGACQTGSLTDGLVADVDVLVAVGEEPLLALAARESVPDVPVLPVNAGVGVRSVPLAAIDEAIEALLDGAGTSHERPIVGATEDGITRARALCDLMLVTAEPARISEYSVRSGDDNVARFRADGVVVATPAGTHGYARSVGAPVVASGTDVVSVVPIAPFATDADHWVLPTDAVTLTVERDEVPVELLADDRRGNTVSPGTPISITTVDTLAIRTVPQSTAPFGRPGE